VAAVVAMLGLSVGGALALAPDVGAGVAGRTGEARGCPRRIVSTTLETDEILLGLFPPERILAITPFADEAAVSNVVREARRVRHRVKTDPEPILLLRPDVVFVAPFAPPDATALLEEADAGVARVPFTETIDGVRERIRFVGERVCAGARTETLITEFDARLGRVEARLANASRPRVLLWTRGGFTAGAGTLADNLLAAAGARNAAAEAGVQGHTRLDLETALTLDPEIILVNDWTSDARSREVVPPDDPSSDPAWSSITAVRTHRVHRIAPRILLTTSHHVAAAVEALARAIHPEVFE